MIAGSIRLLAVAVLAVTAALALATTGSQAETSCKAGKEKEGCALKVGAFYNKADPGVLVTLGTQEVNGKRAKAILQAPGSALCKGGQSSSLVNVIARASKAPKVGSTTKFTVADPTKIDGKEYKTTIDMKLKVTSAKKATLKGFANVDYGDGTGCKGNIDAKLTRALGG